MKYAALLSLLCLLLAVPASAADPTATTPEYVVYYFHGQFRCETCLKIEAWAKDAVSEGFARELKAGNLAWRTSRTSATTSSARSPRS
jgi:predicted outer membrane protein